MKHFNLITINSLQQVMMMELSLKETDLTIIKTNISKKHNKILVVSQLGLMIDNNHKIQKFLKTNIIFREIIKGNNRNKQEIHQVI